MSPFLQGVTVIRIIIMAPTSTNDFNSYSCPYSATINMIFRFTIFAKKVYCRVKFDGILNSHEQSLKLILFSSKSNSSKSLETNSEKDSPNFPFVFNL